MEVLVKLEKINPTLQTVYVRKIQLAQQDEERTVVRFTLDRRGELIGTNELPKVLTPYALDPNQIENL